MSRPAALASARVPAASEPTRAYLRGARVLSVGIAATGILTFAYFSLASHVLGEAAAKRIDVLWSVMFVVISLIYRPVEQLLSRTIAEHRARGGERHALRVPLAIQASFAVLFAVLALALRPELDAHVFRGSGGGGAELYWILFAGTLAYAASYFARGWLAGHERFALFGTLVFLEALSRLCFPLAVAVGIASGQTAVALGIAAAPALSMIVVPAAFVHARRGERGDQRRPTRLDGRGCCGAEARAPTEEADVPAALSVRHGGRFAGSVAAIMLSEQTLLNAAVLTVAASSAKAALAGIVFNVLLIARAPLQLFQAIQTTLLPHLTGLDVQASREAFGRAIRVTVRMIALFAGAVTLVLLAAGPALMEHALFGQRYSYGRVGLALVGMGMGMHLVSGTLNQAALARGRAGAAAVCWLVAAGAFLAWMLSGPIGDQLLRAEAGYLGATTLLAALLALLYRRARALPPAERPAAAALPIQPAATDSAIAR
jgi:O-antigen/teichoic acid export membrane protein